MWNKKFTHFLFSFLSISLCIFFLLALSEPYRHALHVSPEETETLIDNGFWKLEEYMHTSYTEYRLTNPKTNAVFMYTPDTDIITFGQIEKEKISDIQFGYFIDRMYITIPSSVQESAATTYDTVYVDDFTNSQPTSRNENIEEATKLLETNKIQIRDLVKLYNQSLIDLDLETMEDVSIVMQKIHANIQSRAG